MEWEFSFGLTWEALKNWVLADLFSTLLYYHCLQRNFQASCPHQVCAAALCFLPTRGLLLHASACTIYIQSVPRPVCPLFSVYLATFSCLVCPLLSVYMTTCSTTCLLRLAERAVSMCVMSVWPRCRDGARSGSVCVISYAGWPAMTT